MSHSLLSDHPAERRSTCAAKWIPPPQLVDLAYDDEGLIADAIDLFKTGAETRLREVRIAPAAVDIQGLGSEAHSLRGSAVQLGAHALAEACQRLQVGPGLTPASQPVDHVDRVQSLFAEVSSAMASYSNGTQVADLQRPRSKPGQ